MQHSQHKRRHVHKSGPQLEQMRPLPGSALRQKESAVFVFPTKSSSALEISSQSQHKITSNRNSCAFQQVQCAARWQRELRLQLGCMVRSHPHLINRSQLCTHSAPCIADTGWFPGRLRWEFSMAQRRPEIIMSKRQALHIPSVFIKSLLWD